MAGIIILDSQMKIQVLVRCISPFELTEHSTEDIMF